MNENLLNWLKKEEKGIASIAFFCLKVSLCCLALNFLVLIFLSFFGIDLMGSPKSPISYKMPLVILFYAFLEEVEFRFPLYFFTQSLASCLIATVISSVVFGWMHGNAVNILIQGVTGAGLAIIFLKSGGMQRRPFKALTTSTLVHAALNLFLLAVAIIMGHKTF